MAGYPPVSGNGSDRPEVFPLVMAFGAHFRRMVPLLVMLVLAVGLGAGLVLGGILGPAGWGIAAVAAVLVAVTGYLVKKRQFRTNIASATLELSPWGAVLTDRYTRTEIAWPAVRQIGPAQMMRGLRLGSGGTDVHEVVQGGINRAERAGGRFTDCLIGHGRFLVDPAAPGWFMTQVGQNDMHSAENAICVDVFDPRWRTGRIGQWVTAYRADLVGGWGNSAA